MDFVDHPTALCKEWYSFTGDQGTGKNVFTNTICELIRRYANKNLTNIDHLIGKLNIDILNMKLIVCNELNSAETNKYLNSDALKSVISESNANDNSKGADVRKVQNVVKLIIVSNNFAPVKIEGGDRRYVVSLAPDKYKDDFNYFDKLYKLTNKKLSNGLDNDLAKTFYDNLYTFFVKQDLSQYNPRKIPITEVKKAIQVVSKSAYGIFIQEYIKDFIEGIEYQKA